MIESIEIKNFRCFKDTKIAKFGLVNLIGGMNNAGKTALLEAVYLTANPTLRNLMFLYRTVRKENMGFAKEKPENAWDNLFFQQNKELTIILKSITDQFKHIDSFTEVVLNYDKEFNEAINFTEKELKGEEVNDVFSSKSILRINVNKNSNAGIPIVLIADKTGIEGKDNAPSGLRFDTVNFITSSAVFSGYRLATEFNKACFDGKENELLKGFQIIDNTIEKVEFFAIGEPTLYLQRKNEKRMPITLFGDAITKVADFVLRIINNPNSIILIDEIENGIHYTAQAELWEMLFKLAIAYETQIFATSHSFEMIKAFAKVTQEFPEKAAYFEMARSQKTGLIKGIKHDVKTLLFELDRNVAIRGK